MIDMPIRPAAKTTTRPPDARKNRTRSMRARRRSSSPSTAETIPSSGSPVRARKSAGSANTGRIWLAAKAVKSPAPSAAARASGSSSRRFGNTGLGDTRGGSINRKSATPDAESRSLDITADWRRATRSS